MKLTKQQLMQRLPPDHISFIKEMENACCGYDKVITKKHRIRAVKIGGDAWVR